MKLVAPFSIIVVLLIAIIFLVSWQTSGTTTTATSSVILISNTKALGIQVGSSTATSTALYTASTSSKSVIKKVTESKTPQKQPSKPENEPEQATSAPAQVERNETPYTTQPEPFETIDAAARAALVNILCMPQGGTLRPISGSGVMIDPRGVILTNAHVAQYVLLSEDPQINLTCTIRTGSPASPHWKAIVLYIPTVWVNEHYKDINSDHVVGTGEHDYALLLVTQDLQGNPVSNSFPYLPVDTRENIAFEGDTVLGAGYPAEFVGGIVAQQGLFAATSISKIKQLLTFQTSTVDLFSIGGVIEAQGGSSGGPVVNAWHYVVGIISTTSEGATTADRDLHALSLNYINRDIAIQTGETLETLLSGDLSAEAQTFSKQDAVALVQKYIDYLSH